MVINIKDIPKPARECSDRDCPFHGSAKLRGRTFTGTVLSTKMHKTATVQWTDRKYIPKYERYEKRKTKIHAHSPECLDIHENDEVMVCETRPLSKTKHFIIVKKVTGK
jgi:small subunit ribosomal protein S17